MELVKKIKQAETEATQIVEDAKKELDVFADCSEKQALLAIADYALTREL